MNQPTERQREVLTAILHRKSMREIAADLGVTGLHGVHQHFGLLARKGLVANTRPHLKRVAWELTPAGLAALGLRTCGCCSGTGTMPLAPRGT